jgi:hypothetical protein
MMGQETVTETARKIMIEFGDQTGLSSLQNPPRRYLWTDAHAVCNYLSLYLQLGDLEYANLAEKLIHQVHSVLGKHRTDDPRSGWISGLSEEEGSKHPTAGGLRIGKKLNERGPDDPYDDRLEWDRDGQYFHYLTKWMHALCRASVVTGKQQYCRWAAELAKAAHAGFAVSAPGSSNKRLVWKMSIDLSYALVPSSGLHDPLDAYITNNEISLRVKRNFGSGETLHLGTEIEDAAAMIAGQHWHTDDPLGLGGLLFDANRALQLATSKQMKDPSMAEALLRTSIESIDATAAKLRFTAPAEYRLAFRELGLSIGFQAVARMREIVGMQPDLFTRTIKQYLEQLQEFAALGEVIENFWCRPINQRAKSWLDHFDINRVMLATSLLPDQFLAVLDE